MHEKTTAWKQTIFQIELSAQQQKKKKTKDQFVVVV